MKRAHAGLLLVSLGLLLGLPAAAHANAIAKSLGNLRWGMSENDLKLALKGKTKNASYAEFDGSRSRWDSTPVAEEYTHGNEESMLSYKDDDGSENHYFFIGGELWKWVKYYPASTFGGRDFNGFAAKVRKRFGKGHEKQAEVNPGTGFRYKFLEYLDRTTRLRAVDKTERQGQYALVFESMDTVRSLSALRSNTIRRVTNKAAMAKAPAREQEAEEAPRNARAKQSPRSSSASRPTFTLASSKKKSIFADEQQEGESSSDYEARKRRVQQQAQSTQRKQHERKEDAKKGKILDELAGVDDDDPISGMQ